MTITPMKCIGRKFDCSTNEISLTRVSQSASGLGSIKSPLNPRVDDLGTRLASGSPMPGDIACVCASVTHPILELIEDHFKNKPEDPEDSETIVRSQQNLTSLQSCPNAGEIRPCLVCDAGQVCLMATFGGEGDIPDKLPKLQQHFLVPLWPNTKPVHDFEHIHTIPNWPRSSQWVIAYPFKPTNRVPKKLWIPGPAYCRVDQNSMKQFQALCVERLEQFSSGYSDETKRKLIKEFMRHRPHNESGFLVNGVKNITLSSRPSRRSGSSIRPQASVRSLQAPVHSRTTPYRPPRSVRGPASTKGLASIPASPPASPPPTLHSFKLLRAS